MSTKIGLGQDSHRFGGEEPLILAGVTIPNHVGCIANSDGDVIYHAITNAISGITTTNILGQVADEMCQKDITNSSEYLKVALHDLKNIHFTPSHISISIECKTPKITPHIECMRANISSLLGLTSSDVGITATTGEGLTNFGKGLGIFVSVVLTAESISY